MSETLLETGHIRDGVYITLWYSIDSEGYVHSDTLTEKQLEVFTPYAIETHQHKPKHGNSLREATSQEVELWEKFTETLLVCSECERTDVLFNPFNNKWLCPVHCTGLETPTTCAYCGTSDELGYSSYFKKWLCVECNVSQGT